RLHRAMRIDVKDGFVAVIPALDEGDKFSSLVGTQHILKKTRIQVVPELLLELLLHFLQHPIAFSGIGRRIGDRSLSELLFCAIGKSEESAAKIFLVRLALGEDGKILLLHR